MKALIIYDSVFGNTEKVAQSIGEVIGGQVLQVGEVLSISDMASQHTTEGTTCQSANNWM